MKTLIQLFVVVMVSLWAGMTGMAQPSVGDSYSGAAAVDNSIAAESAKPTKRLANNGFVGGVVEVEVVPVLGNPLNPGNGWAQQIVFQDDWKNSLTNWVPVIKGAVLWTNLVYAQVNGVPTSTNSVVQLLVRLKSIDGSDSINIKMFSMRSVDTATGSLSDDYEVGHRSYSPAARGFKADGTVITGGPNDQMVAEIGLVVQMRLFSGGATRAGLLEVRDWVLRHIGYLVKYQVFMDGREVRGGDATITVQNPYLTITRDWISFKGEAPGYLYDVQFADPVTGEWRNLNTAYSGDSISIVPTGNAKFFRAVSRE
jgi:hypothetical protein